MSEQSNQPSSKRTKQIDTWFLRSNRQSSNSIGSSQASVSTPIFTEQQQPSESPVVNSQTQSIEFEPEVNSNVLERDPGKRCPIRSYPVNERDSIRRAYILLGPFQPKLKDYPLSPFGSQNHKFSYDWFDNNS